MWPDLQPYLQQQDVYVLRHKVVKVLEVHLILYDMRKD